MLSDEVLEKVIDRLIERINKGNEYVITEIGKSISQLRTVSPTKAQQLAQILKYGGDFDKIVKKLSKITELNVKEIYKIFEEVAKNDYQFAEQFYNYRGIKYIPFDENDVLKRQVNAIAEITAKEYLNLARTTVMGYAVKNSSGDLVFKNIKQVYYELIDEAIFNVSQGKETFDEVMYRKLKEIGESGLKVVYPTTYIGKDGKEHHYVKRLDSAIRMNIKDGLRTLHNETQQQFGKEFKSDGVEISVHLNPAPDHQFVQGHQFSNEEFEKFQTDQDSTSYDGTFYPAESEETGHDRRSIGQYNCYHYVFSIVLGISKPEYTSEQLQDIIDKNNKGFDFEGKHYSNYEGTQLQRKIELEIRKAKDNQILGRTSNNEQLIAESQTRITQLTNKYRKLNQVSGLPSAIDRARVSGYRRVAVDKNKINKRFFNYEEIKFNKNEKNINKYFNDGLYENVDGNFEIMEAIQNYTDEDSKYNSNKLNWSLRNNQVNNEEQKAIDLIKKGINMNKLPINMNLYRGITGEEYVENYSKIGNIIEEKGFLSTTIFEKDAKKFLNDKREAILEIEVEKDMPSIYIGDDTMSTMEQSEILFAPNRKLQIKGIENIDENRKKIKAKMLK